MPAWSAQWDWGARRIFLCHLKTLKFHSVFRTRPAAPLTFLLTALFFVPVLPSSHVFADGSIFCTRPAVPLTFLLTAPFLTRPSLLG